MIGEKIRQLRKERNLTLRELAAQIRIPFTSLGNYERGDRKPDLQVILEIAKYFGVSMDYLTREEVNTNYEEHQVTRFTEDMQEMLNKATPEVREKILNIFDQIYSITCEHTINSPNQKELDQIDKIINSISRMKNGFGMGIKKGGFSPSAKLDFAKLYLKEKQEIDKTFNELFEIYIERAIN